MMIAFGKDGDWLVILLAGGTRKRQDADIAAAKGHPPGSQSPEDSLGGCVAALNRHISNLLKDFLSMVLSIYRKISH